MRQSGVTDVTAYGFHSSRAGAALNGIGKLKAGVSHRDIKQRGIWASDAFRAYIRPDEEERLRASSRLALVWLCLRSRRGLGPQSLNICPSARSLLLLLQAELALYGWKREQSRRNSTARAVPSLRCAQCRRRKHRESDRSWRSECGVILGEKRSGPQDSQRRINAAFTSVRELNCDPH